MSTYHEWFASSAEKITVKNAKTTVNWRSDSFPAKAPWVEPVNEFNAWNEHVKAKADSLLTPATPSAAPIVKDSIQLDFTLASVEELPVEVVVKKEDQNDARVFTGNDNLQIDPNDLYRPAAEDEPAEPGYTDLEIIAMAPERMRGIDPCYYIGKVIGPKQFDILAARGRREGFGIECEWMSDDHLCNWKLIKVWSLAKGYDSTFTFADVREGVITYVNL